MISPMKKLTSIILVLLTIGTLPVASWAGKPNEYLSEALNLKDAQEYVRQNPDNAEAHYKLGVTYANLGRYQETITLFKEAIRIKPDYVTAHYNLGLALALLKRLNESNVALKEAIRIKPDFAEAHTNLAANYLDLRRPKEAIAHLKKTEGLKPLFGDERSLTGDVHANFGIAYQQLDLHQKAIVEYKEALRINPNHTIAHNRLNKLEQGLKRPMQDEWAGEIETQCKEQGIMFLNGEIDLYKNREVA